MSIAHVHRGDDWQALASIYQPNINGSVAQNMMALLGDSTALTEAIQRLQTTLHSPDIRLHCALDDLPQALIDALPTGNGMAELARAIHTISDAFCTLFECDSVALRLSRLNKAMCPKFHVDHIPVRLIWTLAGPGTEWLSEDNADRSQLGTPGDACRCPGAIQHLQAGDIALMKGEGWEGNEGFGFIHRSPALASPEPRLVLTLDLA